MKKIIAYKTILLNTATNCTFIASKLDEKVQTGTRYNDGHIEWAGELDISILSSLEEIFDDLYEEIKHGDDDHKLWLKESMNNFITKNNKLKLL